MDTFARIFASAVCICSALSLALLPGSALAETAGSSTPPAWTLSGPHSFKNLDIYLVRGPDSVDTSNMILLDEAVEKKLIRVHETSSVNELMVENLSKDKTIFIQAGDIVKGGRQDRTLSSDLLLKPKSGKVPLEAFCVEQSRWHQRGNEPVEAFAAAEERLPSKELKRAAAFEKRQDQVWNQVAVSQTKLSAKVGKPVAAPASTSSLQLSLENADVNQKAGEYKNALENILSAAPDAVGFVFAINGALNSADVYGSHQLFKTAWPRLLTAAATEALAEENAAARAAPLELKEVEIFLKKAESGSARPADKKVHSTIRETDDSYFAESYSSPDKSRAVHKMYLKK